MKYSKYNFWILWLLLMAVIFFSSCSPQARLNSLIKNHPELAKRDTIFRNDTTIIAPAHTDTLIYYKQTDTVIVKENGMTVKYFYNTKDSTVYIRGERDTITIIRAVPYTVNSIEVKPETFWEKAYRIAKDVLLLMTFGALIVLFFLMRKR